MPPDLPGDVDAELLGRYLGGGCTEAETAVVRRYLMSRSQAARALEGFLASLDASESRPAAPNADASWLALRQRLHTADDRRRAAGTGAPAPAAQPLTPRSTPPRTHATHVPGRVAGGERWRNAMRVATAASVLAAATYVGTRHARLATVAASDSASVASRTYVTQARERAELRLADGTRVRLAPGSRLRVAADYGTERRDVSLEGEGFFDVVHDAQRPFTVFAANASAHDLGTAFAVRSYRTDDAVQVVVRAGAVALSGVGRLARGDVGRLTAEGRGSVRHGVDVDARLGWLDGTLVFEDAPLRQVLQDLGRWYEVDARLTDPALAALPFTGTLDTPDAEHAVRLVAATLSLRVRHEGTRFVLAPTPGRTPRAPALVRTSSRTLSPTPARP